MSRYHGFACFAVFLPLILLGFLGLHPAAAAPVVQPIYPNMAGDLQPAADLGAPRIRTVHRTRTMHAAAVRRAIRRATSYNLHVTNAVRNGEFSVDNRFVMFDGRGRVYIDARNVDPVFFARVAPGRYTVIASNGGEQRAHTVFVSDRRPVELNFIW